MVGVRAARLIPPRLVQSHDRRPEASAKRVVAAMGRVEPFQHQMEPSDKARGRLFAAVR